MGAGRIQLQASQRSASQLLFCQRNSEQGPQFQPHIQQSTAIPKRKTFIWELEED